MSTTPEQETETEADDLAREAEATTPVPASMIPAGYEGPIPTMADLRAWQRWGDS